MCLSYSCFLKVQTEGFYTGCANTLNLVVNGGGMLYWCRYLSTGEQKRLLNVQF